VADIRLLRVYASELNTLKEYVAALLTHTGDFDSMVNIEAGVNSLLKNENLSIAYFITKDGKRIGFVILSRLHNVKRGGLTIVIDEFFVEEEYRRQGIASIIMNKIQDIALIEGAKSLLVSLERTNLPAQAFATYEGFVVDPSVVFVRPL